MVDRDAKVPLVQLQVLGNESPRERNGVALEVVSERKVAKHLEEREMPSGVANLFEIVVLAARADALLRGGRATLAMRRFFHAKENALERNHAGVHEKQRRIIGRHERTTRFDYMLMAFEKLEKFLAEYPKTLKEFENLLTRNRIFIDRTTGVGPISAERALNYGFTGPNLRASGVDYDVRVHTPYSSYEDFNFTVPVGTTGDCYDRFLVRNKEMWQSIEIIKQAYQKVQEFKGTDAEVYHADAPNYYLPEKKDVYTKMEALIYHFKIVMGETEMPVGEVYSSVEGGNGELGFYLISDGGRTPYRLHFRRPCFIYYQAYPELIKDSMLSDAIITMSSLNLIAGELDA